ncbi:FUSC family protein [Xanthobacter sp. TB0139]|uniref:FUSC family protein n=1 Tax=Xanthobacter sp. TB0139 TaxID=3459178 RepID=UPI0040390902
MAEEKPVWFRLNGPVLLFGLKFTLASLLALGISFWSSMPDPKWSVITVAVLANANTDQVAAKSLARVAGTIVGALVGLALVALFAEHRVLFMLSLCLWLGLCQWMLMWFRDLEAYIFALSGYTGAIVGLSGVLSPDMAADIAVSRATEVCIGILATWAASAILFPRFGNLDLPEKLKESARLLNMCLKPGVEGAAARVQLADLFAELHRYGRRISLGVPGAQHRVNAIRSMNRAIMSNLFISRALSHSEAQKPELMALVAALPQALSSPQAAEEAQKQWGDAAGALQVQIREAKTEALEDEKPVSWQAFAGNCVQILQGYRALHDPKIEPVPVAGPFHIAGADSLVATIVSLQLVSSVLIITVFWWLTAWDAASIGITIASVYTLLLTTTQGYRTIIWGILLGLVPALVVSFQIVPLFSDFPFFALAISPFLLVSYMLIGMDGPYKLAGVNIILMFLVALDPENVMTYDMAGALEDLLALTLSFAVCGVVGLLVLPVAPWLLRLRLLRAAARTLRRSANADMALSQRSQMRLTFLASTIAPQLKAQKANPYYETEIGFATGLAATAFAFLEGDLDPQVPWAGEVRALQAGMARLHLYNWRAGLAELVVIAEQGHALARDAIGKDEKGDALYAASAFKTLLGALRILSTLRIYGPEIANLVPEAVSLKAG